MCYIVRNTFFHGVDMMTLNLGLLYLVGQLQMSHIMRNQHFAYVKTKVQISFAVTVKLISMFVFTTRIAQFLFFLNLKFPASSHLLCLYSSVCVRPVQKSHCWFSHGAAQNNVDLTKIIINDRVQ